MTDLRSCVLNFLEKEVFAISKENSQARFLVMVSDEYNIKIINTSVNIKDINKAGVGVVLNIEYDRSRMDVPAIYLIEPTEQNIEILLSDFGKKKSLYPSVHIFFNGHLNDELMSKLSNASKFIEKVKTLREIDLNFFVSGKSLFDFRLNSFEKLYKEKISDENKIPKVYLKNLAKKLSSVCILLKEYPFIRFWKCFDPNSKLTEFFEKEIKKTLRKLPDWQYIEPRATIVILDRSFDPVAPLMHDFTFKAMVADLLQVEDDCVCFESNSGKEKIIISNDKIWEIYSNEHIATVIKKIPEQSRNFLASNPMLKMTQEGNKNIKDLSKVLRNAPQYKKEVESFNKNITIADACMTIFKADGLKPIGDLEQDIATGLDKAGEKIHLKGIRKQLDKLVEDEEITEEIRVRLVMIACARLKSYKSKLSKNPEFEDFSKESNNAIKNFIKMLRKTDLTDGEMERNKQTIKENSELSLMRFKPKLEHIVNSICENKLSLEDFPFLNGITPEKTKETNSPKRRSRKPNKEAESERIIIFINGGVTYSEIRTVQKCAKKYSRDIVLGSTKLLTPSKFIEELSY